ncbi:MAG: hypothetical protein J0L63_10430, partial [Anaerolineae bacterium]|nr:hypothetical protein [Anaerolineae bacterium]
MSRYLFALFMILGLLGPLNGVQAQTPPELIAPNLFLRGLQLPQGVRYTASFIKPVDDLPLRNISVEMTLPADAQLLEMLVSRQVQFDVIRRNRAGQLTLIWQLSRLTSDQSLDAFTFTLQQPLTAEVEFYMVAQTEDGIQQVENFFELPPLVVALQSESVINLTESRFTPLPDTGIQILPPADRLPLTLSTRLLAADFNPPPEYGRIWWCSLLDLQGLPQGSSAQVIVPLRRPVAAFTSLQLFRQQPDGSWEALPEQGVVTADGQFVVYNHPGGLVASGGPEEIQPETIPAQDMQIVQVDMPSPPQPAEPQSPENPPAEQPPPLTNLTDGTSNTIIIGEATQVPPTFSPPTVSSVTDGTSNTIIISEATQVPPTFPPPTVSSVTDGTSNTILIGEATLTPTFPPPTVSSVTDGTSNTIIIGEATLTPTFPPPTASSVTDGTSNTIIIGEATLTPTFPPPTQESAVPTAATGSALVTPTATLLPPPSVPPVIGGNPPPVQPPVFSPALAPLQPNPFGTGNPRVQIVILDRQLIL